MIMRLEGTDTINLRVLPDLADLSIHRFVDVGCILIDSIIGNLSSCIRIKPPRARRVRRVRLGRRMCLEAGERRRRWSILLGAWLRGRSRRRRSRRLIIEETELFEKFHFTFLGVDGLVCKSISYLRWIDLVYKRIFTSHHVNSVYVHHICLLETGCWSCCANKTNAQT
jgi:hypothetical protein